MGCSGGASNYIELETAVKSKGYLTTAKSVDKAAGGILKGVAYLHAQDITHSDLKPRNILVNPEGKIKIIDFGMATEGEDESFRFGGSYYYRSSETLVDKYGTNTFAYDDNAAGLNLFYLHHRRCHTSRLSSTSDEGFQESTEIYRRGADDTNPDIS